MNLLYVLVSQSVLMIFLLSSIVFFVLLFKENTFFSYEVSLSGFTLSIFISLHIVVDSSVVEVFNSFVLGLFILVVSFFIHWMLDSYKL